MNAQFFAFLAFVAALNPKLLAIDLLLRQLQASESIVWGQPVSSQGRADQTGLCMHASGLLYPPQVTPGDRHVSALCRVAVGLHR